jgi:AcrR family transcriptional regulator
MDTRLHILDAAERLVRQRGVGRVTTKAIAREAGCAEGSIFNHFTGKNDLLLAVVGERLPAFGAVGKDLTAGDVAGNLTRLALAAIRLFESVIPVAVSLFSDTELLARHKETMRSRKGGPHNMLRAVADYLETEQQRGVVRADADAISVAAQLFGACFFWVFIDQTNGTRLVSGKSENQFVEALVRSVAAGLVPGSKSAPRRKGARPRGA